MSNQVFAKMQVGQKVWIKEYQTDGVLLGDGSKEAFGPLSGSWLVDFDASKAPIIWSSTSREVAGKRFNGYWLPAQDIQVMDWEVGDYIDCKDRVLDGEYEVSRLDPDDSSSLLPIEVGDTAIDGFELRWVGWRDARLMYVPKYRQPNKETNNKQQTTNEMKQTFTVTRSQMQEIHNVACSSWKTKIEGMVNDKFNAFSDTAELDRRLVKTMFDAAEPHQLSTLESVFPEYDSAVTFDFGDSHTLTSSSELLYIAKGSASSLAMRGKELILDRGYELIIDGEVVISSSTDLSKRRMTFVKRS